MSYQKARCSEIALKSFVYSRSVNTVSLWSPYTPRVLSTHTQRSSSASLSLTERVRDRRVRDRPPPISTQSTHVLSSDFSNFATAKVYTSSHRKTRTRACSRIFVHTVNAHTHISRRSCAPAYSRNKTPANTTHNHTKKTPTHVRDRHATSTHCTYVRSRRSRRRKKQQRFISVPPPIIHTKKEAIYGSECLRSIASESVVHTVCFGFLAINDDQQTTFARAEPWKNCKTEPQKKENSVMRSPFRCVVWNCE